MLKRVPQYTKPCTHQTQNVLSNECAWKYVHVYVYGYLLCHHWPVTCTSGAGVCVWFFLGAGVTRPTCMFMFLAIPSQPPLARHLHFWCRRLWFFLGCLWFFLGCLWFFLGCLWFFLGSFKVQVLRGPALHHQALHLALTLALTCNPKLKSTLHITPPACVCVATLVRLRQPLTTRTPTRDGCPFDVQIMKCTSSVHHLHIIRTLSAHYPHVICTLSAHYPHIICTSSAHHLHIICTSSAHYLHIICTSSAHYLHIICTLSAHYLHIICTLSAHHLHTICTLSAHHPHIIYTLSAHYLRIICTLPAHHLHIICRGATKPLLTHTCPVLFFGVGVMRPPSTPWAL